MKAADIGLPTAEASVSCGQFCLGGSVNMTLTDGPEYTDAEDVWVRGDIAGAEIIRLTAEVERLRGLLRSLLEPLEDQCFLDHNGNCQTHYIESPCRVAAVRAALAEPTKEQP